ncbi:MAG: PadR family transcriptional regulator [Acidobacteriota bacterium]
MPRTDALIGSLDLLVLKTLASRPGLHGYALMTAIQVASEDALRVEEGSLYPALRRMEEAGWLSAKWVQKDNGRRARAYRLTHVGKKQLAAEEERWLSLAEAVRQVLRSV